MTNKGFGCSGMANSARSLEGFAFRRTRVGFQAVVQAAASTYLPLLRAARPAQARVTVQRARRRARREARLLRKRGYRLLHPSRGTTPAAVVLILGCQRSGTTLMLDLFTEDLRSMTFAERSVLSRSAEDHLRLKPLAEVNRHLKRLSPPLLVLKPLVESQNAPALLAGLENSFAIWMYRRYDAVATSDLTYFGFRNGERNLRLLLSNDPPNFRGEFVPETTRSVVSAHYSRDMNPFDAAALFWWARTSLYFDLELDSRSDVMLCSYDRLISDPEQTMRSLYAFIGVDYPAREITQEVHRGAADRGSEAEISPDVRRLCDELQERLDAVIAAQ